MLYTPPLYVALYFPLGPFNNPPALSSPEMGVSPLTLSYPGLMGPKPKAPTSLISRKKLCPEKMFTLSKVTLPNGQYPGIKFPKP